MTQEVESLRELVDESIEQLVAFTSPDDWSFHEAERIKRLLAAAEYRWLFDKLLSFVQQECLNTSAGSLTVEFLESGKGALQLRKAAQVLATQRGISQHKARKNLLHAVVLQHYGQGMLSRLETGEVTVFQVEELANQVLSQQVPEDVPGAAQEELDELQARMHEARQDLADQLTDIASEHPHENDFKREARQRRDETHPLPPQVRAEQAAQRRTVKITPCPDSMARIEAYIPSHTAMILQQALATAVRSHRATGTAGNRSRNQIIADVFVDLLLTNPDFQQLLNQAAQMPEENTCADETLRESDFSSERGEELAADATGITRLPEGVGVHLVLKANIEEFILLGGIVDERLLADLEENYPHLYARAVENRQGLLSAATKNKIRERIRAGHHTAHPVGGDHTLSPQSAADLIAAASEMSLVLTDMAGEYTLGVGRKSYRPSKHLKHLIRVRDQHCRAPGCRAPFYECEYDHVQEWAKDNGGTDYANLICLCREHHRMKTLGTLTVKPRHDLGDGVMEFGSSFDGATHVTHPKLPLAPHAWKRHQNQFEHAANPPF